MERPIYFQDDDNGIFMGSFKNYDLYVYYFEHTKKMASLLARFGNHPSEYVSGFDHALYFGSVQRWDEPILEALKRAIKLGFQIPEEYN